MRMGVTNLSSLCYTRLNFISKKTASILFYPCNDAETFMRLYIDKYALCYDR